MKLRTDYLSVFGKVPIFGMIHLAGEDPITRALEEIKIYEENGLAGAIVENYHGSIDNIIETLKLAKYEDFKLKIGVNVLPNDFYAAFNIATKYDASFIQLDHVAGRYLLATLEYKYYESIKNNNLSIFVFGGVWPKYYEPVKNSNLEEDLRKGMSRAEAIVVTGKATGMPTPVSKINLFKKTLKNHPLLIGSGLNLENAYEQLMISDGAIVGSYFKENNNTKGKVDEKKVKEFMKVVNKARLAKDSA